MSKAPQSHSLKAKIDATSYILPFRSMIANLATLAITLSCLGLAAWSFTTRKAEIKQLISRNSSLIQLERQVLQNKGTIPNSLLEEKQQTVENLKGHFFENEKATDDLIISMQSQILQQGWALESQSPLPAQETIVTGMNSSFYEMTLLAPKTKSKLSGSSNEFSKLHRTLQSIYNVDKNLRIQSLSIVSNGRAIKSAELKLLASYKP